MGATVNPEQQVAPKPERWPGPTKMVRRRDYSGGNLRDKIARLRSLEELGELALAIAPHLEKLPARTRRQLGAAVAAKKAELERWVA